MKQLIHRLWLGPNPMPQRYRGYGASWAALNPGWTVHDWTAEDLPPLTNQAVYDQLGGGAVAPIPLDPQIAIAVQRADVVGYELVHRYGGVYVNCDLEPLRPLDGALPDTAWAAYEDATYLNNGAIGAPEPGSAFWAAVIHELPRRLAALPGRPMNQTTGPHLLTHVWRSRDWTGAFTALPREHFHYAHYDRIRLGGTATAYRQAALDAGAIALHHWGHRHDQAAS